MNDDSPLIPILVFHLESYDKKMILIKRYAILNFFVPDTCYSIQGEGKKGVVCFFPIPRYIHIVSTSKIKKTTLFVSFY